MWLCSAQLVFSMLLNTLVSHRIIILNKVCKFLSEGDTYFCGHMSLSKYKEMSFKCPKVLEEIEISDGYMNIFENNISQKLAKTVSKIMELRRNEEETCP